MILVAAQNVSDKGLLYPHRAGSSLLSGKLQNERNEMSRRGGERGEDYLGGFFWTDIVCF